MPPKKRGHAAAGKASLFRHAVENVHVSLGHTILGSISLRLAAGPPRSRRGAEGEAEAAEGLPALAQDTAGVRRPAFYQELNELMQSHSSKDFKKFRYEVAQMCETYPLFKLNERRIAEKLVSVLLDRTGGVMSHKTKRVAADGDDGTRGTTTESFEAFARLTVAFARDVQEGFFQYFEIFHKTVYAGIFARNGQLIASADRLQLVFSVQASWCREMAPYWDSMRSLPRDSPAFRLRVRAIRLFTALLVDSKEYVRRLSAEVLAYLCRLSAPLASLIIEECGGDVLRHYEVFALAELRNANSNDDDHESESDDGDEEDPGDGNRKGEEEDAPREEDEGDETAARVRRLVWTERRVRDYVDTRLSADPMSDGLQYFIADLFRGMRGALSSYFECFYVQSLQAFQLISDSERGAVEERHPAFAALLRDREDNSDDDARETEKESAAAGSRDRRFHSSRWQGVFEDTIASGTEAPPSAGEEGSTCRTAEDVAAARLLFRALGCEVLSSALQTVFTEVSRTAVARVEAEREQQGGGDFGDSGEEQQQATHRMLAAVVNTMQPAAEHLRLLSSLLVAAEYYLWRNPGALPMLRQFAHFMVQSEKGKRAELAATSSSSLQSRAQSTVEFCAAFLELLYPSCLVPYQYDYQRWREESADGDAEDMTRQKLFLPVGKKALELLCHVAYDVGGDAGESAEVALFCFSQDVLQKHYAFCLEEERSVEESRLRQGGSDDDTESEDSYYKDDDDVDDDEREGGRAKGRSGTSTRTVSDKKKRNIVVRSSLTPLALTLLHHIAGAVWHHACSCLSASSISRRSGGDRAQRCVERAVLLARLLQERTRHMLSSPLDQLLRLAPRGPPKSGANEGQGLVRELQQLMLCLANAFRCKDDPLASALSELFSCSIPLLYTLFNQEKAAGAPLLVQLRARLICVLGDIQKDMERAGVGKPLDTTAAVIYAQISSFMVNSSSTSAGNANKSSGRRKKNQRQKTTSVGAGDDDSSLLHLSSTIAILADGFTSHYRTHKDSTTDDATASGSLVPGSGGADVAQLLTESGRENLLTGTELLLSSLLWYLGVDKEVSAGSSSNNGGGGGTALVTALKTLHSVLPKDTQEKFVRVILFEAMVSPKQSLRILALRLLQQLCHPSRIQASERLHGLDAVPVEFFQALLDAEEYNPLSTTGNLGGIRQALTRLIFAVESGALTDAGQRAMLARAMIGLLYLKLADAWAVAMEILTGLVAREETSLTTSKGGKLEPVVWDTVIAPHAHLLVFGDVYDKLTGDASASSSSHSTAAAAAQSSSRDTNNDEDDDEDSSEASTWRCFYRITLTTRQRHERGELVSKAFSSLQYTAHGSDSLMAAADSDDGALFTWAQYLTHRYRNDTTAKQSTDRPTLAQNFLKGLAEMVKTSSALDRKLQLVEQVTVDLCSIEKNEHPSGLSQLRRLEDRMVLAMNACSAAPTTVLSARDEARLDAATAASVKRRNQALSDMFLSYLSSPNNKVQAAVLLNLRRLRVFPFHTYYAQLTPYCDANKSLFHFLSSFHLETGIPAKDQVEYVSAALIIALPKLVGKVAKEKRRDQTSLSRRLMGFLTQLSLSTSGAGIAQVLDTLVRRLILSQIANDNVNTAAPAAAGGDGERQFDFLGMWEAMVVQRTPHAGRRLERLMRQLGSTVRLLDPLVHAAGQKFAGYAYYCLCMALQSYLFACRSLLRAPLEALQLRYRDNDASDEAVAALRWCAGVERTISRGAFAQQLAQVRKGAVAIAILLFEQFPEACAAGTGTGTAAAAAINARQDTHSTLLGRYVAALCANSRGMTADGQHRQQPLQGAAGGRSQVTPMMRLMKAWVKSPALLPLVVTFADEVVDTLGEVFAIHPYYSDGGGGGGSGAQRLARPPPVHKAAHADVYDGFQFVANIFALADEPVATPAHKGPESAAATVREVFIQPHMQRIFTYVYRLIVSGADEAGGGGGGGGARSRRFSVMSFSLQMWGEIMQTVSLLAQHLRQAPQGVDAASAAEMHAMLGRLLEVTLRFISHPACITDSRTAVMAVDVFGDVLRELPRLDRGRHYRPLVHLLNTVSNPAARVRLCGLFRELVPPRLFPATTASPSLRSERADDSGPAAAAELQMEAVGRAVVCLNGFEDGNANLNRYDYELRYHTFNSLIHFFHHDGNYGARKRGAGQAAAGAAGAGAEAEAKDSGTRWERDYGGELDCEIPLHRTDAPVLCIEGMQALAAQAMYFLRDPERPIRTLALQLLQAMLRYSQSQEGRCADYSERVLEQVVRHGEVLPSLRRGVHAKDVHIRGDHMNSFGALGRYYGAAFPSFHKLYAPNADENFFYNVNHVQPRCRLHALAILRREAASLSVRDLLRVFVPFLMNAVKDFAQGKRDLPNMTESRSKGYCDAVLTTIAAIAEKLPWEAYYRILTLFLINAQSNASLRMPMLKGVVQVLNYFHFLDDEGSEDADAKLVNSKKADESPLSTDNDDGGDDDEDNNGGEGDNAEDEEVEAAVRARRRATRHMKIIHVLQQDIIPQLYSYVSDGKNGSGKVSKELQGNIHTMTNLRKAQEKEDRAHSKNTILQLPVAVAITKIAKHFAEEDFNTYVEQLLDELVRKLRTKNDRHRESARRILGAMLQETGPGKLRYVVTKLKDHLVDGYQLHVLGYTVVTLLFQLYEPKHNSVTRGTGQKKKKAEAVAARQRHRRRTEDPVSEEIEQARLRREAQDDASQTEGGQQQQHDENGDGDDDNDMDVDKKEARRARAVEEAVSALEKRLGRAATEDEREEIAVGVAEEDLLQQFRPHGVQFDYAYGIECLTKLMDELMLIFLDDYLGETGMQKEQVELMSKMVEVKRNRAAQGFAFLARHCNCELVMDKFIQRITWVLTPPSDTSVRPEDLRGSAKVKAILLQELKSKYMKAHNKGVSADAGFVSKVRLLATRVARSLLSNPTMDIGKTFEHTCRLLQTHNATREEKIAAFEAKDGTRRIRGNAHMVIHAAPKLSRKELMDKNFLIAPTPERVDVDFSAHTVLATQQKQKLRMYKGRYGSLVKDAARSFYREDPTSAVVMDTLDEFLLRYLLSVLKRVLGIGKERTMSKTTVRLDLIRRRRAKRLREEEEEENEDADKDNNNSSADDRDDDDDEEREKEEQEALAPSNIASDEEDDLEQFAEEQQLQQQQQSTATDTTTTTSHKNAEGETSKISRLTTKLTVTFTQEYRTILEALVPAVLDTLQGEGSDAVVGNALDCLLALLSLRPPLAAVQEVHASLMSTVLEYFARGGAIKQRAMRVCAAIINHQRFTIDDAEATRLVVLCRAEITERSEFMPMALSVFYAILGKHVHVPEAYDLIDVVTELLLHLSARPVIRKRCTLILVRFLTEYKLTVAKFRTHMDLFCKNLDYPEVTGRVALLQLLETLSFRLPTAVLRQEAPMLLVPLSAALTSAEWTECRQTAGRVIESLAKNAGVDVLAPTLSKWMASTQPRPVRAGAAQTWAVVLHALARASRLPTVEDAGGFTTVSVSNAAASPDEGVLDTFVASCSWSVPAVTDGCFYREGATKMMKAKAKKAAPSSKGWLLIFYSLRCAEAMCVAAPSRFYPLFARRLVPFLSETLIEHPQPWITAVALRIVRHYCYTFLEGRCGYLLDHGESLASLLPPAGSEGESEEAAVPFALDAGRSVERCREVFLAMSALLKRLLTMVASSDVSNEKYTAHRAILDPARTELLKLMVYLWKAMSHIAVLAVVRAGTGAGAQAWVAQEYGRIMRSIASAAEPIVRQRSVANYMVRTATLTQFFGGAVSLLPLAPAPGETGKRRTDGTGGEIEQTYVSAVRWLLHDAMQILPVIAETMAPVVVIALHANARSEKISSFGHHATTVIQQQLELRRALLIKKRGQPKADDGKEAAAAPRIGTKRKERETEYTLDDVLLVLAAPLQETRMDQREQAIRRQTEKQLKKNRTEMVKEGKIARRPRIGK